ncbi:MAG: armadillo-type protein [Monoraphidium minutum]|nr:MAG: armadillo-type protein [Monoraphidium minutum]
MGAELAMERGPPPARWAFDRGIKLGESSLTPGESQDEETPLGSTLTAALNSAISSRSGVQRRSALEGVGAAAEAADFAECSCAAALLGELLRDSEPDVRVEALRQLVHLGAQLHAKDAARAQPDIQHVLLPMALSAALDDHDEVARQVILTFSQLAALLPRDAAAAAATHAIHKVEARGAEDGAVAAARLFAHSAASWSDAALHDRVPDLLRRWCSHRDFSVREAIACCLSLVGGHLPIDVWQRALLPWFEQLCRDNNWRVRRAAALDLPRLAGKLRRQQQRVLSRADSTCSCSTSSCEDGGASGGAAGGGAAAPACGCSSCSAPRCRTSGVPLEPIGAAPTGGCTHAKPGGGALSRGQLKGHGGGGGAAAAAAAVPHVWSAHSLRPPPAATSGSLSMGKHPLSSSLLVDEPLSCDSPHSRSSSSLSSSDDRALAGSPPAAPSRLAGGGGGGGGGGGAAAADAGDTDDEAESKGREGGEEGEEGQQQQAPACALALEQPELHACWATMRECVDCLTADSSHWVKVTALAGLGPCLLALPPCQLSGLLIGRFVAMGSSTTVISEISVALACAQSLGLVAARLGPARWPDVRPAFGHLQASRDPVVLQELVAALPLMAAHLGDGPLRADLVPALLSVVHDHLPWVDAPLVAAVPPLLEALPPAAHDPLLRVVARLAAGGGEHERCRAWRLRRGVAAQLGRIARATGRTAITDVLWPAAVALCSDPVAAVRDAAAVQVGPLLAALLPLLPPAELQQLHASRGAVAGAAALRRQLEQPRPRQQRRRPSESSEGDGLQDVARDQAPRQVGAALRCLGGGKGLSSEESSEDDGGAGSPDRAARRSLDIPLPRAGAGSPFPLALSPIASGSGGGACGSFGSSASDDGDDGELLGGLPCALAAPPCGGLSASPPCGQQAAAGERGGAPNSDAGNNGAGSCGSVGSDDASSCEGDSPASSGASTPECASPERPAPLPRRPGARHPGMSAVHPVLGAAHPVLGAVHPAMAPVGAWASPSASPRPRPQRSQSARDLPGASPARSGHAPRRLSSASRLSSFGAPHGSRRSMDSNAAGVDSTSSSAALDPLTAPPALYVDALVDRFGRNPSFRGRQLFVPIGLGLLAHAAHLLPRRTRELVTATLEALARDGVPCVRVVAESAAAALRTAAAERAGGAGSEGEAAGACAACAESEAAGEAAPGGDGGWFDTPVAAQRRLLLAARALARGNRGSFEAASAALGTTPVGPSRLGPRGDARGGGVHAAAGVGVDTAAPSVPHFNIS